MKLVGLISEMIDLVVMFKKTYTDIDDTVFFSNLSLSNLEVRLNCGRIIDWIYFKGDDPSHSLWIEEGGHLDKTFLQFMDLGPIKEFFTIKEGIFMYTNAVSKNDAIAVSQLVRDNYKPYIFKRS